MANPMVLDACVLLNLIASDRASEIFLAQQRRLLVGERAAKESFYLRSADDPIERLPVELSALVDASILEIVSIDGENETDMFIEFAASLDDGEAESLAVAHVRGYSIATDDRKARRVFSAYHSGEIELLSTPELVHRWTEHCSIDEGEIQKTLESIHRKANYYPSPTDPYSIWWNGILPLNAR